MRDDIAPVCSMLAGMLYERLEGGCDLASFEEDAMSLCRDATCRAMAMALEDYDEHLLSTRRPEGCVVHDRKSRTLLCECGAVTFARRALRTPRGEQFCMLDEALGIVPGSRVSPGAFSMVVQDALAGSYARAAELLCRHTRTSLSRASVSAMVREAACAQQRADDEAARDLFGDGLAPCGDVAADVLCVEADGTYPALQGDGARRAEVKCAVAYAGKRPLPDGRASRVSPVFYAGVMGPDAFWKRAVARFGQTYDIAACGTYHLGTDGEAWCKGGATWLPGEVVGHLDAAHLSRAISGAFRRDGETAARVGALCRAGRPLEAAELIGTIAGRSDEMERCRRYIANNAAIIGAAGPSLGTVEADNATLYKKRLGGQRAWSLPGLSAVSCLIAAHASGEPVRGRKPAETPRRRRIASLMGKEACTGAGHALESVGSGYEPPSGHLGRNSFGGRGFYDWVVNGYVR